jgi:hypothetical protein
MLAAIIGRRRQGKSTLALALARSKSRTVIVWDPNNQYGALEAVEPAALEERLAAEELMVRVVPAPPIEEHWAALTDVLDGGSWRWSDYVLVVDEGSMLMSPSYIDDRLERYIRTAPADVGVVITTHRPRDVHPLVRALATDLFCFQTTLERDIEVLRENYGETLATAVQGLRRYHVAHYWLAAGGEPQMVIWDDPAAWYIDIGRRL